MNNQSKSLWISLAAGIFAAFLMYSYSQEKKAEFDKQMGAVQTVIVAKKDVQELMTIDDEMIEVVQRPVNFIEPGALQDPDLVIGQVAANPLKKGEQILANKLLSPGPDTGISFQVSPSKRALTIPIDEVRAVARLIRPGDRVDILTAVDVGRGVNAKREVITMLTDVPVLATGLNVRNNIPRTFEVDPNNNNVTQVNLSGDTRFSTITVEVSPKEAQDLVYLLATSPGSIFFTLKHPHDRQVFQRLPASSAESILGRPLADANTGAPGLVQPGGAAPRPVR